MTAPRTRTVPARLIRSGDVILTDPLDRSTAADVADLYRSEFATTVEVTLVLSDGRLASLTLQNDQPVRRVS